MIKNKDTSIRIKFGNEIGRKCIYKKKTTCE